MVYKYERIYITRLQAREMPLPYIHRTWDYRYRYECPCCGKISTRIDDMYVHILLHNVYLDKVQGTKAASKCRNTATAEIYGVEGVEIDI